MDLDTELYKNEYRCFMAELEVDPQG